MEERVEEAFELDERLTVVGCKVRPGDTAPDFNLDSFDPINACLLYTSDAADE